MKKVVSIVDFGAKCDGTVQTEAIQAAIDHCYQLGGGEVVVPAGAYLTGGIRLRSDITLRLHLKRAATCTSLATPTRWATCAPLFGRRGMWQ